MAGQGDSLEIRIGTEALAPLMRQMDYFAPDLRKRLLKEIRSMTTEVRNVARASFPRRTGESAAGIKSTVRVRRQDEVHGAVYSSNAGGSILEFANVGHTGRGRTLVSTLTSRYGSPGRFMWRAHDALRVPEKIEAAVAEADRAFTERMRKA